MSDDSTDQFLDKVYEDGEPKTAGDITLATGVKWSKLALTMLGSLVVGWFLGLTAFIRGIANFFVGMYPSDITRQERLVEPPEGGIIDAFASFWADVLTAILTGPVGWLETAARESAAFVNAMGILAFPAGVAVVMAGLYALAKGFEVIRE